MKAASVNLKAITLECGGKSPLIVCDDADLQKAVNAGYSGITFNAGQVCTATSRIFVHESIYEEYMKAFKQKILDESRVSHPFEAGTTQGPQVLTGGAGKGEGGYFVQPTIFVGAADDSIIMQEEIFGPVASSVTWKDEAEVIRRANQTSYGLAALVFTQKLTRAHLIAEKLQVGMVWINSNQDSHYGIPFGGWKSSGIGKELGEYGLTSYTNVKAVHVNLDS
ncbi:hypothetical protein LTR93_011931 [Exophiala xenobiotica]|nr:hypothetical protein LTR93_011931 [Exophiala xenobiotica]